MSVANTAFKMVVNSMRKIRSEEKVDYSLRIALAIS